MAEVVGESWSLCPTCFREIQCTYETRGDDVWQVKACPEHGTAQSKVWAGVEHWQWTRSYDEACCQPLAEGDAARRRCLAVVDVTTDCNMACDFCFASSGPGGTHLPLAGIDSLLETVLRESGGPTPIQFSGGEPTVRDDLPTIVALARDKGFRHIEVNSNGLRLAKEPRLARRLKEAGATTVYLQFDGFGAKVYRRIRASKDLTKTKGAAIEACRAAGLQVILVPTVVPGVNEDQLGEIVRFALRNIDVVRGVNVQPVSHFGRYREDGGHLSLPAVARQLAKQTGFIREGDLLQVPCCSPQCSSATMLLAGEDRKGDVTATPLTRFVSDEAYRDVVAAFEEKHFMDLLAGQSSGVKAALDAAACCGIPIPAGLERLTPRMLALTVTGFMDADNVDLERLGRCCINVPTPEGKLVPFCGYNLTDRDGRYRLRERYARPSGLPVAR